MGDIYIFTTLLGMLFFKHHLRRKPSIFYKPHKRRCQQAPCLRSWKSPRQESPGVSDEKSKEAACGEAWVKETCVPKSSHVGGGSLEEHLCFFSVREISLLFGDLVVIFELSVESYLKDIFLVSP